MFKFILIFAVLVGSLYIYATEDMETKAKSETESLKEKVGGLLGKLHSVEAPPPEISIPQPVHIDIALLTVKDTQGAKLNKSDAKVKVYNGNRTIVDEYIDANSQIRVSDVQTLTSYYAVVEEGYGMARFYRQEKNIQFASEGADIDVQRRALIKPLSFSEGSMEYGNQVNLSEGKYLLLFKLKSEGQGVVRRPSIILIPKEKPAVFVAWIWDYQDMGLGLPESLQKEMLSWNIRYQFSRDLSENAHGTYALQIENITKGKFDFCVYDDANLEQQCASFIIGG